MKGLLIGATLLRALNAELLVPNAQPGSARAVAAVADPVRVADYPSIVADPFYPDDDDDEDYGDPSVGVSDFDGDGPGYVDDNDNPFWYNGGGKAVTVTVPGGYPDDDCSRCVWDTDNDTDTDDDYPDYPILKKKKKTRTRTAAPTRTPLPLPDPYDDGYAATAPLPRGRFGRRQGSFGKGFNWPQPSPTDDDDGYPTPTDDDYPIITPSARPSRRRHCPKHCTRPTASTGLPNPSNQTTDVLYPDYPVTTTFLTVSSTDVVTETIEPTTSTTSDDDNSSTGLPANPSQTQNPSRPGDGNTLANLCPAQCNPESGKNICHPTTTCVTSTGVYPSSYFCMCRAGFRASDFNNRDFARQFRVTNPLTQSYVRVEAGLACDTPCQDQLCTEVMIRDQCLRV